MMPEIAAVSIKWAVLMTYLIFQAPDDPDLGTQLPAEFFDPSPDCTALMMGTDYDKWVAECITSATPEPLVYDIVTEMLVHIYDTREECQLNVDDAVFRWAALAQQERLIGLTLKCIGINTGGN